MNDVLLSSVINGLIVLLLSITIGYCYILNRRIKILQDSRGELAKLLKHFDNSTKRASDSIVSLQAASKNIGDTIQHRIDKANYLIDDLAYMIDKGDKLANKMEAGFAVNRAQMRAGVDLKSSTSSGDPLKQRRKAQAEKRKEEYLSEITANEIVSEPEVVVAEEVKQTVKKVEFPKYELPQSQKEAVISPAKVQKAANPKSANISAMLERIASRSNASTVEKDALEAQSEVLSTVKSRSRSKAEEELLELIKAGMKG